MLLIHPISFEVILSFSCLVIFVCVWLSGVPSGNVNLRIAKNSGSYPLFWDTVRRGEMREHWLLWSATWHNHTQNYLYSLTEKQHWAMESPHVLILQPWGTWTGRSGGGMQEVLPVCINLKRCLCCSRCCLCYLDSPLPSRHQRPGLLLQIPVSVDITCVQGSTRERKGLPPTAVTPPHQCTPIRDSLHSYWELVTFVYLIWFFVLESVCFLILYILRGWVLGRGISSSMLPCHVGRLLNLPWSMNWSLLLEAGELPEPVHFRFPLTSSSCPEPTLPRDARCTYNSNFPSILNFLLVTFNVSKWPRFLFEKDRWNMSSPAQVLIYFFIFFSHPNLPSISRAE